MAIPNTKTTIETEIGDYVAGLSAKNKQAVLTVVKTIAEAEKEAEFERKWTEAVPLEEAFQQIHDHIKTLKWKEKSL